MINSFQIRGIYSAPFHRAKLDLPLFCGTPPAFKGIIVSQDIHDWIMKNVRHQKIGPNGIGLGFDPGVKLVMNPWNQPGTLIGIGEEAKLIVKAINHMMALQAELSADVVYIWDPVIG